MSTKQSAIVGEVLDTNENSAATFGGRKDPTLAPARGFAVLTCSDARLDPTKYAGLAEGDAHIIRSAGGRATEAAIRSLVMSHKQLGSKEWFVVHHSNCGKDLSSDETGSDALDGHFVKWHTIADQQGSVEQDVRRIREHPLVPSHIPIYGYVYDVHSGRLVEVEAATAAGRAV